MAKPTYKILLIDDDSDILELLTYNLSHEGYDVLGLANPLQALETIQQFSPNLLVMDIMMPGMNGFQLCTAIRSTDEGKSLVIFFMTTGEGKLSKPAIQCGADDFIEKFSGLRTLINRINLVMKNGLLIRKRISIINIGPWELNREDQTVLNQTHKIELSDLEFDLLYFLAQNAKRSIPIKSLNSVINSSYFFHKRKTITQSLQALAKKIGEGLIVFTGGHRVRLNS